MPRTAKSLFNRCFAVAKPNPDEVPVTTINRGFNKITP